MTMSMQIQSFEAELAVPELAAEEGGPSSFRGVFIRAPAILEAGPEVKVLADYLVPSNKPAESKSAVESQEVPILQSFFVASPKIYRFCGEVTKVSTSATAFDCLDGYPKYSSYRVLHVFQEETRSEEKVIVAVKQGNLLGTTFHPELTADTRWHSYFLKMVNEVVEGTPNSVSTGEGEDLTDKRKPMTDLPIFQ
ncbi:hypothetical protein HHK36_019152 [Tetracentron sinense]|uniref:Uncharacterized protein n=1 Tax=Tetracentron sinense TaxID=13715 RepID=A0A835DCH8_TETSI|nr:hypothetical protein HHK36_019152 [Tetracentron sinense]